MDGKFPSAHHLQHARDSLVQSAIELTAASGSIRFAIHATMREKTLLVDDLETVQSEIESLMKFVMEERDKILHKLAQIEAKSRG